MTSLSPALDAALRSPTPTVFGAISIDLPDRDLNLLDGAGVLPFAGRTFYGEDATYGVLSEIDNLTDGTGDSAPALSITLLPNGDASAAALANPTMQGSAVAIWLGAVNPQTGLPYPEPELIFLGELDVPILHSEEHGRRLDYEVVSVFERLFEDDESAVLSPGHHRSIFPGEAGMDFVTGVAQPVYWGVEASPSSIANGSIGTKIGYAIDRIFG
jgi:hypothetical protein